MTPETSDGNSDRNDTPTVTTGPRSADDASARRSTGNERLTAPSRRTVLRAAGASLAGLTLANTATIPTLAGVPTPRLHTEGRWLRDPDGNAVKLRGMAPADPGFYRLHHPKSFEEVLEWATDTTRGWHPNTVRLPCTQDSIDSLGLETYVTEILRPAVDLLSTRNVYAMVDFHLIRPYTQAATETYNQENEDTLDPIDDVMRAFWERVAPEFADDEHVIYELFNEPTQPAMYGDDAGAWQTWRDAAQPWVDLVQDHASETPLIVGSPRWTSVTHMAPEYSFEGENLVYAGHIYPDNGAPSAFDQYYGEPANDVPVVISEFGWDPAGGNIDQGTNSGWGRPFRDWVEGYANVGWISWCFDDSWAPTFFESPGQGASDDWTLEDGDEQMGGFVKTWLAETRDQDVPGQTVDDGTAPAAPSNLAVTRTTEIGAEIAWDGVTDRGDAETAGLSHYAVYVDGERRDQVVAGTTQAAVQGLEPRSTYEVGVSAVDAANNESPRATVVVETIATDANQTPHADHAIPGTIQAEDFDEGPSGVAYSDTTEQNQAGADYRDTAVDIGTSASSGYNVGYVEAGEWLEYTVQVETGGTHVAFVNAASGASQGGSFRLEVDRETVATQDVWNTGGWSNYQEIRIGQVDLPAGEHVLRVVAESGGWNVDWLEFTWEETGGGGGDTAVPTAPSNLAVTDTSPSSVSVAWNAASDSGGSGLDRYEVSVDGSLDQQVPAGTTSATVADLAADTGYEITVTAVDGAGNASPGARVSASTDAEGTGGDTTPPTTPGNVAVTGTTTTSVDVSWDAAADSGTGVERYVVSVDGSQDHTVGAGSTSASVSGLSAGTSYDVAVAAVDGAGNESAAASVTASTDPAGSDAGDGSNDVTDSASGWWGSGGSGSGASDGSGSGDGSGGWWGTGGDSSDSDGGGWW